MKTLAFLFNTRSAYPGSTDVASHLNADLDDLATIEKMEEYFRGLGYAIIPIEADEKAYVTLYDKRREIDLVFNYALGIRGESGYAQIPAMLEMLGVPYTGSGVLTQALVMNKARMYEVLKTNRIMTPSSQVFKIGDEIEPEKFLEYPLIVKPVARGSSAGITQQSLVDTRERLAEQVHFIWETFNEPALVSTFLPGREFSVGMVGNPPQLLPVIEPVFSKLPQGYLPFDSLEVKWTVEEEAEELHLTCPAKIDKKLESWVSEICHRVWKALDIRDYCRIDLRGDEKGALHVLDVNSPAGLIPPEISDSSYFPMAARAHGIGYDQLLQLIIKAAKDRYGLD